MGNRENIFYYSSATEPCGITRAVKKQMPIHPISSPSRLLAISADMWAKAHSNSTVLVILYTVWGFAFIWNRSHIQILQNSHVHKKSNCFHNHSVAAFLLDTLMLLYRLPVFKCSLIMVAVGTTPFCFLI